MDYIRLSAVGKKRERGAMVQKDSIWKVVRWIQVIFRAPAYVKVSRENRATGEWFLSC